MASALFALSAIGEGTVTIPTTESNPFDCSKVNFDQVTYSANWNGNNIDYIGKGDIVSFDLENTEETAYQITFDEATILEEMEVTLVILNSAGTEVYNETVETPCTSGGANDWSNYISITSAPVTPVLSTGSYKFEIRYGAGLWEGQENYFACNINNIAFTAVEGGEKSETVETKGEAMLHGANFDKANSTNDLYVFTDAADFTLQMENRDVEKTPCNFTFPDGTVYSDGINFKNNATGTIVIPAGKKVYALAIGGCSQSDSENLCYLYSVDKDGTNFFTEAIGQNIKDNDVIGTASYVIKADGTAPQFAYLDFSESPATSTIAVVFSGNNQENVWFNIYYTEETEVDESSDGDGIAFLHGANFDKDHSTNDLYVFTDALEFTLGMENRDINKTPCDWIDPNGVDYTDGINFKKNAAGTINIPEGLKVYALEIGGCSQSDANNLCYLYSVEKDGAEFFTEPIGQDITDNSTIESTAKYPMFADGTAPQVAFLDFTSAPATSTIKVVTSGNNQVDMWFKLYLSKDAVTGINSIQSSTATISTAYNLSGQQVGQGYKGLVIKNGKKYIQK